MSRDAQARIEAGVGILEDHLHAPAQRRSRRSAERGDVLARRSALRPPSGSSEAQDQPPDRGLAAAGLADEAEHLAGPDRRS